MEDSGVGMFRSVRAKRAGLRRNLHLLRARMAPDPQRDEAEAWKWARRPTFFVACVAGRFAGPADNLEPT
jgi:hypothetical protein